MFISTHLHTQLCRHVYMHLQNMFLCMYVFTMLIGIKIVTNPSYNASQIYHVLNAPVQNC